MIHGVKDGAEACRVSPVATNRVVLEKAGAAEAPLRDHHGPDLLSVGIDQRMRRTGLLVYVYFTV
jgi:hypothetical protein